MLSPHAFKKYFALSYFSSPLKNNNLYMDLEVYLFDYSSFQITRS